MTNYGVRESQYSTGNPLCDKLKYEYRSRTTAAVRRAESTSVMIRRVQAGLDPYEHAPNPLLERKTAQASAPRKVSATTAAQKNTAAVRKTASTPTAASRPTAKATAKAPARTSANAEKAAKANTESRAVQLIGKAVDMMKVKPSYEEVRVARKPFPFAAVSLMVIFTVMVLTILFSAAQNYELSGEIAEMEKSAQALAEQEQILALQLEERNDIRVIEDIAVNQIGMVKNDLVESRFVSVSGGDWVELALPAAEQTEKETQDIFSTMLSAIGENLNKIGEYID